MADGESPRVSLDQDGCRARQDALVIVYATFPSETLAEAMATDLLDRGLAACINILPAMTALYNWKGARARERECIALVKSRADLAAEVVAAIVACHPYESPAVVVLPIIGGAALYLDWVRAQTRPADPTPVAS